VSGLLWSSGPNVIKLFTSVVYKCSLEARVFVLCTPFEPILMFARVFVSCRPFQPIPMFASKAGAYLSEVPFR
jgi:hypothetical protein